MLYVLSLCGNGKGTLQEGSFPCIIISHLISQFIRSSLCPVGINLPDTADADYTGVLTLVLVRVQNTIVSRVDHL